VFITPAVAGATLYIGSCSGRFLALDLATGEPRWSHDTAKDGAPAQFHGDVLLQDGFVFVGADADPVGHLYAFDVASGRLAWKLAFPGGVPAQVLGRAGVVFAQAANGEVWALEARTGKVAWTHRAESAGPLNLRQVDPVLAGDRLVVGWPSGDVEALDASSGRLLWRAATGSRLNTSIVVAGSHVLVGAMDGKLHRLALADGAAKGARALGGLPFGDLMVTDRCLLVLTMKDGAHEGLETDVGTGSDEHPLVPHLDHLLYRLSCRDEERGEPRWEREYPSEITTFRPLVLDGEVIVGYRGRLTALRVADGSDVWACAVEGVPRGTSADAEQLYVGTLAGTVVAFPRRQIAQSCRLEVAAPPAAE
jgi:outer membrane protein assembly factor BamB